MKISALDNEYDTRDGIINEGTNPTSYYPLYHRQERFNECPNCKKRLKEYVYWVHVDGKIEESWTFRCGTEITKVEDEKRFFFDHDICMDIDTAERIEEELNER